MAFDSESDTFGGTEGSRIKLATGIVSRMVKTIVYGRISVVLPSGDQIDHSGEQAGPSAALFVHRWRAIRRLISGGDLGFAQAYIDGDWSSPDLATLMELAAMNMPAINSNMSGFWLLRVANRLRHLLRANSKSGSRRNIAFHYDLGNAFYQHWLDPQMTYSSALYAHPDCTLEDAQDAKLNRVLELLALNGGESILEIGCGWGGLAVRLAQASARVTGITLSSEQLKFAQERVAREGLTDKVSLELRDYRDVEGTYDRIVSIEMLEAVGEAYWPTYFKALYERLNAGGVAVLQAITIDEGRFGAYRASPDFIQRHIFPGGMLPTKTIIAEQIATAGLELVRMQNFGESYAATLAEWRRRFLASWPSIEKMGFPQSFRRLWDYYLCYCEAGFRAATIDVGLYVLAKR